MSENLIRKYIKDGKVPLSNEAKEVAKQWKEQEAANKGKGNISIPIRREASELSYLSMDDLANLVDKTKQPLKEASLSRDANEYKPIRDAMAHTALLTKAAKKKLSSVRENIKGRVNTILGGETVEATLASILEDPSVSHDLCGEIRADDGSHQKIALTRLRLWHPGVARLCELTA